MFQYYAQIRTLFDGIRSDEKGVVSFEYVIVAACIVAAVGAAFGTGGTGPIFNALSGAITTISGAVTAAVGGAGN